MIIFLQSTASLNATNKTFEYEFVPTYDLSNCKCLLRVEQMFMTNDTQEYTTVRCNLTQPRSAKFDYGNTKEGTINDVIYIHGKSHSTEAPYIPVYVADGPQPLRITIDTEQTPTPAIKFAMILSLVADGSNSQ